MPARYYQKNKKRLQKKAHEKYQNLSEKYKNKNPKYSHEGYRNLSDEEKIKAPICSLMI